MTSQRPEFIEQLLAEQVSRGSDDTSEPWEAVAFRIADAVVQLSERSHGGATRDECLQAIVMHAGVLLRDVTPPAPTYTVTNYVVDEMGAPIVVRIVERDGNASEVEVRRHITSEYPG